MYKKMKILAPGTESLTKTDIAEDQSSNTRHPAIVIGNTLGRKANDAVALKECLKGLRKMISEKGMVLS